MIRLTHYFILYISLLTLLLLLLLPKDKVLSQPTLDWASQFNGGGSSLNINSMTIDDSGNVYVTGNIYVSSSGIDIFTVKYDSFGNEKWVAQYSGPGISPANRDYGMSVAVGEDGSVFVTGYSDGKGTLFDIVTIKYNFMGAEQWVKRFSTIQADIGRIVCVDSAGNVLVGGESNGNIISIKYDSIGNLLWSSYYNVGEYCQLSDMKVSKNGMYYISGRISNPSTGDDILVLKLKYSTGNIIWEKPYESIGSDYSSNIEIDQNENVYVVGSKTYPSYDYITIKYDSSGVQKWVQVYNGIENGNDEAKKLVISNNNYLYVTGSSLFNNYYEYVTIKYDTLGNELWVKKYNNNGNTQGSLPKDMVVDELGNCYITGVSHDPNTNNDIAIVKYSSSGNQEWVVRYNSGINNSEDGAKILLYNRTKIITSGRLVTNNPTLDYYLTLQYSQPPPIPVSPSLIYPANNSIGNELELQLLWTKVQFADRYRLQLSSDSAFSTIIYEDSTITDTSLLLTDLMALTKYYWKVLAINESGAGNYSNVYSFSTKGTATQPVLLEPGNDSTNTPLEIDFLWKSSIDSVTLENVGEKNRFISNYHFQLTIDTLGIALISDSTLSDTSYYTDSLEQLTTYFWRVKAKNEIGWGSFSNWFKFTTTFLVKINNGIQELPSSYNLHQNFPNPFNPSSKIRFDLPQKSFVKLSVYDLLGREISRLVNSQLNAGSYSIDFNRGDLPSGVYFYKLEAGEFVQIKRMVLLK